jgi:hypothetical protein
MIWWFLILGMSTLVVVCVAIALFMRLRRHLRPTHAGQDGAVNEEVDGEHHSGTIEH